MWFSYIIIVSHSISAPLKTRIFFAPQSGSNLVALLQKMCTVFTDQAPVCSRPAYFPEPALTPTVRADFRKTFNAMEYKM